MATNKQGVGMRILWIPGRKRHDRKGRLDSTKKNVSYTGKQKPNQAWTLGGSDGHKELMKVDVPGCSDASKALSVLPTCAVGLSTIESEKLQLESEETKKNCTEPVPEDKTCNKSNGSIDGKCNGLTNINKLPKIDEDLDLIEPMNENNVNNKIPKNGDDIDGIYPDLNDRFGTNRRKNKKTKRKNQDEINSVDKDEKTVKCLYYALMCCECSIS